jgi:hypothetical protein
MSRAVSVEGVIPTDLRIAEAFMLIDGAGEVTARRIRLPSTMNALHLTGDFGQLQFTLSADNQPKSRLQ